MKRALFTIFLFYFTCAGTRAQVSVKDSSVNVTLICVGYGYCLPGGDMLSRFGNNSLLQLSVMYKLQNYWTLGLNAGYLFGKTVKENIFDSIAKDKVFINDEEILGMCVYMNVDLWYLQQLEGCLRSSKAVRIQVWC
jgi:hypothetical protein